MESDNDLKRMIAILQEENKRLKDAKTTWIPVSERLPEHTDDKTHLVLVWIRKYPKGYFTSAMLYPDGTWGHVTESESRNITHWKEEISPMDI